MTADHRFLTQSEKCFGIAMLIILIAFWIIAKNTGFRNLERLSRAECPLPASAIVITVSGCVKRPGAFEVLPGASVRKILRRAQPLLLADLSNIDLDRALESSCILEIPRLKKIIIEVRGCVQENTTIELPAGSRVCDLKKEIKLADDADPFYFRRRKILKNHEIVFIPKKRTK